MKSNIIRQGHIAIAKYFLWGLSLNPYFLNFSYFSNFHS